MANQHTTSQTTKPVVVRTVFILVAAILLVLSLDQSAAQLSSYLSSAAIDAIALLPSLVLTASQALQPDATAQHPFSLCSLQMLLFWPALQTVAKVVAA